MNNEIISILMKNIYEQAIASIKKDYKKVYEDLICDEMISKQKTKLYNNIQQLAMI